MLEELGVPYELERVDVKGRQNRTDEYLGTVHPLGHVPALTDGDVTMFESAAIVLYLADKFPEKALAPKPGTAGRAHYYQWSVYAMVELEPAVAAVSYHTVMRAEDKRIPQVAAEGRETFAAVAEVLTKHLASREYMLGADFTAVDVLIGGVLGWGRGLGLLEGLTTLQAYGKRISSRPAFQRARAD